MANIILLTGSLGAGKTTTLLHISKQMKVDEVIVSDAARTNVDAKRTGAKKSLQGCACCVALPELKKYLKGKQGTLLIEASGLSESEGISQAIIDHETCWVHVVNAATYEKQKISLVLKKFLKFADIILVNKTDKTKYTKELVELIKKHAEGKVIKTIKGRFDTKHLHYRKHVATKKRQARHDQKAISVRLPGTITTKKLEKHIQKYPRAKGWYTDDKHYSFDKTESFEKRVSTGEENTISIIGLTETSDALYTTIKLIGATRAPLGKKLLFLAKQIPEVVWDMR